MYNWKKDIVQWKVGKTLYMSIVFTWQLFKAKEIAEQYKGKTVIGGPAVMLAKKKGFFDLSWAETPNAVPYDTLAFHNPCATYTSRGCPNKCSFCAVPKIEGDLVELDTWKAAPVICDNNLTACSEKHFEKVVDSLLPFPMVDFQGIEANRLTDFHIWHLKRLKRVKLRIGFDHRENNQIYNAVKTCIDSGIKDLTLYCLIGHQDTPTQARSRLELVRSWGLLPTPQRFQPLNALRKDSFIEKGWTEKELRNMMRYYSRLNWLGHIEYGDYQQGYHKKQRSIFQIFDVLEEK